MVSKLEKSHTISKKNRNKTKLKKKIFTAISGESNVKKIICEATESVKSIYHLLIHIWIKHIMV